MKIVVSLACNSNKMTRMLFLKATIVFQYATKLFMPYFLFHDTNIQQIGIHRLRFNKLQITSFIKDILK